MAEENKTIPVKVATDFRKRFRLGLDVFCGKNDLLPVVAICMTRDQTQMNVFTFAEDRQAVVKNLREVADKLEKETN